jgi:hypothetical protein
VLTRGLAGGANPASTRVIDEITVAEHLPVPVKRTRLVKATASAELATLPNALVALYGLHRLFELAPDIAHALADDIADALVDGAAA